MKYGRRAQDILFDHLKQELANALHATVLSALLYSEGLPFWGFKDLVVAVRKLRLAKTLGGIRRDDAEDAFLGRTGGNVDNLGDVVGVQPMLEGCKLLRISLRIREGHLMGVE